jgi:hypothetical protein
MQFIYKMGLDGRFKAGEPARNPDGSLMPPNPDGSTVMYGTAMSNGACQGISMWWIIKRSLGDPEKIPEADFWTWFGPPKSAAPTAAGNGKAGEPVQAIREVMEEQDFLLSPKFITSVSSQRQMNHDAATNYIVAKSNNRLVKKEILWAMTNVSWTDLVTQATKTQGFAFIGFSIKGWGGHAVAAHIFPKGASSAYIEFMDPNIGEVEKITSTGLKEWYADGFAKKNYGAAPETVEIQMLTPR